MSPGSSRIDGFTEVRSRGHNVHPGVNRFTGAFPGCRRVLPWSLGSKECALELVWLIRGRCVHSGAPWVPSGSVEFTGVRPGCRQVHPGSLGTLGYTLAAVGFILGRCARWGAPGCSSGSSWFAGFTGVQLG